jgi:hypothetical protein
VGDAEVAVPVVCVIEVPLVGWLDWFAAAAALGLAGEDCGFDCFASVLVRAAVAAGLPAGFAFPGCAQLRLVLLVEGEDIDCGLPFEDLPAEDA